MTHDRSVSCDIQPQNSQIYIGDASNLEVSCMANVCFESPTTLTFFVLQKKDMEEVIDINNQQIVANR